MLDQEQFKEDLKAVFSATKNSHGNEEEVLETFVDALAACFIKHMKTIKINYTGGLTAPNGGVVGTLNHTVG